MGASAPPQGQNNVALRGFSHFERSAIESGFRLSTTAGVRYQCSDALEAARFIIADADHPGVINDIVAAGREGDTVFVGAHAPDGALAWTMRPIDPLHLLRQLDAAVALRDALGTDVPLQPPHASHVQGLPSRPAAAPGEPMPARRASDHPLGDDEHRVPQRGSDGR